ncbi:hypothetical protein HT031_001373 [Scenedesmus sp. PABB004]|nr:hypothetical protein HT031_001373 [Scenedesmus sp. PABB004]
MARPRSCGPGLLALCLAAALVRPGAAQYVAGGGLKRWTPATFPDPQRDVDACGRGGVRSNICDPEMILDARAQNMVDGLINEIAEAEPPYKAAPCGDKREGFHVAVAVMHHMDHRRYADKGAAAQGFARALHDAWGVGSAACQNGALILLAIGDRQVYISTGAGVKSVVSDARLAAVLDNIKPALKHKRYADAVLSAVQQVGQLCNGLTPDSGGVDGEDGAGIFLFFCACIAAVVGWGWWSSRRSAARFKACSDKLAAIRRDQAAIRGRQYAAVSCPICLEDFAAPPPGTGPGGPAAPGAGGGGGGAGEPGDRPDASPSAPLLGDDRRGAASAAGAAAAARAAGLAGGAAAAGAAAGASAASTAGAGCSAGAACSASTGASSPKGFWAKKAAAASASLGAARRTATAAAGRPRRACPSCCAAATPSATAASASEQRAPRRRARRAALPHAAPPPSRRSAAHAAAPRRWLKTHTNCPICRKDLDAQDDPGAAARGAPPGSVGVGLGGPGGYPPGAYPPGAYPPGAFPPGAGGWGPYGPQGAWGPHGPHGPRVFGRPGWGQRGWGYGPQGYWPYNDYDMMQQQVWLPELGFRLRRLRAMYPDYITDPMLYAWEEDLASGRTLDNAVVQFEAANRARQAQLEQAGRFGASEPASFGGGSSRNGGGAGSSW